MSALLSVPPVLFSGVMRHLRARCAGVQESGAFLLGRKEGGLRVVTKFLPYEELQHDALREDHVLLTAASFGRLWDLCRREQLAVVADVHAHPGNALQSRSDRENPMVAINGHIALIVPRYARGNVRLIDVMAYVYRGNHSWDTYGASEIEHIVRLTDQGGP